MVSLLYQTIPGHEVTDDVLTEAADLFSSNFGTWGPRSGRQGQPIRLSGDRLRELYLPDKAETTYASVSVDNNLAGFAFACRWKHAGMAICWVTQLVVRMKHRKRGLACGLLTLLRNKSDDVYGIVSSHPAACLAAATIFSTTIEKVSLRFIQENAKPIMRVSPIAYIRNAELCGTIFDDAQSSKLVSGVNEAFFVDLGESSEALRSVRTRWLWPLGELPDGHEYLLIIPNNKVIHQHGKYDLQIGHESEIKIALYMDI